MTEQQISVGELKEYWKYIENLKDGDVIERYVATYEMPAWNEICYGLDWRLHRADAGYFGRKEHGYCGVYRVIGLVTDNAIRPATISRACGDDESGTLYLGETGWLNQRLNQLRRSLHGEDTHGASRMWRQSAALKSRFPSSKLGVAVLFTKVRMHGWIERDLVRAYLNSFGDTPPLNCSF
jgi:hypothetical protein